ncbi:ATP-dependent endonuclease [Cyclobacterium xiamenense]|uniref:ATP-dependent nuclease n=1 Tax=Cyclobacterium xiamenense TaxID=1297121 RepID=UPI0035CF6158
MADIRKTLISKFKPQNAYGNFGAFIKKISINGFRGMDKLDFEIEFPITAISGTNGSGKSTIGQIAACGYRKPATDRIYKRHYVKDFFPKSVHLDPTPFTDSANIIFNYATNTQQSQTLTIARKNVEWSGYKRQPERHSFYVGFAAYIPKIERRGISIYNSKHLVLTKIREVDDSIKQKVARILNSYYDKIYFQGISAKEKSNEIGVVSRYGYSYSENNMGFGEGRLLYVVDLLENEPDNSLFILEEPETSLHGDAQYQFVKYLMDVVSRKGHQIIFSTHSSTMLEALPPEGRKFLIRDKNGVKILNRISAYRARSILANGFEKAISICVEDVFAKSLLSEIIRTNSDLELKSIQIAPIGDKLAVATMVKQMNAMGIRTIGIRDADVGKDDSKMLYSFPGSLPPEKEVFLDKQVIVDLNNKYSFDVEEIFKLTPDLNHHDYSKELAKEASTTKEIIEIDGIRSYLESRSNGYFDDLIKSIKDNL